MQSFKSPSLRHGTLTAHPWGPWRDSLGLWELEDPPEFLEVGGGGRSLSEN